MADMDNNGLLTQGDFLGGYRIVEHLSERRSWDVYLAKCMSTQRVVSLKVLHAGTDDLAERARAVADLEHPNIVRIYEVGAEGGRAFIAQEHVEGPRGRQLTLTDELVNHGGHLSEDDTRIQARQILGALIAVHRFRDGVCGNGLRSEDVFLTAQRRAKVADLGFSETVGSGAARDFRDYGQLVYRMLTGRDASDWVAPSSLGFDRKWDRLITSCLNADDDGRLPDADGLLDELLNTGEAPRSWRGLITAACLLLLASLVAGGVWQVRRQARLAQQAEQELKEKEQADREAQVAKFLNYADQAVARMQFGAARKAVAKVQEVDPENERGRRLLEDIRTAEGLALIGEGKTRADNGWARVRDLDRGQGMGTLIRQAETRLAEARKALADTRFEDAKKLYLEVGEEMSRIQKLDAQRDEANEARGRMDQIRELATAGHAAEFAKATWETAQKLAAKAEQDYETRQFSEAAIGWKSAGETYARAEREGVGGQRIGTAKAACEAALARVRENQALAIPPEVREKAEALVRTAETLATAGQWEKAADSYAEAGELLGGAVERAREKGEATAYKAAVEAGKVAMKKGSWTKAEAHFGEALSVPGYRGDRTAAKLLASVSIARLKASAKKAYRSKDGNLVFNGDFERGKDGGVLGWATPDNLTIFWGKYGVTGRGIRMDTDVYRSEWEEHRRHPTIPMKKTTTSGTRYNTVGGTTGVALYSLPIQVEPDGYYLVQFDIKGQGEPFLYIKGFWKCGPQDLFKMGTKMFFKPFKPGPSYSLTAMGTSGEEKRAAHPGDYIQNYRRRLVARFEKNGEWRRFRTVIKLDPDRRIETLLLELYAFWPPGDYYFDNVVCKKVDEKALNEHEKWRKTHGKYANFGRPVPKRGK